MIFTMKMSIFLFALTMGVVGAAHFGFFSEGPPPGVHTE